MLRAMLSEARYSDRAVSESPRSHARVPFLIATSPSKSGWFCLARASASVSDFSARSYWPRKASAVPCVIFRHTAISDLANCSGRGASRSATASVNLPLTAKDFCLQNAESRGPFDASGGFAGTKRIYVGACPDQISALYLRPGISIKSLRIWRGLASAICRSRRKNQPQNPG